MWYVITEKKIHGVNCTFWGVVGATECGTLVGAGFIASTYNKKGYDDRRAVITNVKPTHDYNGIELDWDEDPSEEGGD